MYISNATGCSSIWGGPAATSPYCTDKNGHGPAWANSLFEDIAEHGLGMYLGQEATRNRLADLTRQLIAVEYTDEAIKAAGQKWLDTMEDGAANKSASAEFIASMESVVSARGDCDCDACKLAREILKDKEYLEKKSVWIFGGDGWAYDIGFGGQVAQFAAAGKETKKKSLAEIAMSYGYVYVAQVAMGANPAQTLKAIQEAEAYHGPSLIIGYAPCEMHSIKGGMTNCQAEMKKAVECGYWNLFRFNPAAETDKFIVDSKEPKEEGYRAFLMNEARYSRLTREFPDRAETLFKRNEEVAMDRYQHLLKLKAMYDEK